MRLVRAIVTAVFLGASLHAGAGWFDFSGPLKQLDVIRKALRDELWPIAEKHAQALQENPGDAAEADLARLARIEALSGAQRYGAMLEELDRAPVPAGEEFLYWRAWALERLGREIEAGKILTEHAFTNRDVRCRAQNLLARTCVRQGNRAQADAAFAEAWAARGTNDAFASSLLLEWAEARAAGGDAAGGLKVLENARDEKSFRPPWDAVRAAEAEYLAQTGATNRAQAVRLKIVEAGLDVSERVFVAAALALARSVASGGEGDFLRKAVARARQPDLRRAAGFQLGFFELRDPATRKDGVQRIEALVREAPDAPEAPPAALTLAACLLEHGDAARAEAAYRHWTETYPAAVVAGDARALEGRGRALLALGRRTEAIGAFARAVQVATNLETKARCVCRQGDALVAEGRFDEAARLYAPLGAGDGPYRARALFARADALERAGETNLAERSFRALAAGRGAEAAEAAVRLAGRMAADGRLEEAVAAYGAALARHDLEPARRERAHVGRGRALYRAYRFKEAVADFRAVAAENPARRDEMRFWAALCRYGTGDEAGAKADVTELLAEATSRTLRQDLTLWLAKYDLNHGNYVAAETGFEAYAQAVTNRPVAAADALVRAAHSAMRRGDFAKTVEWVTAAVRRAPAMPFLAQALVLQAEALTELARYDDAVLVADRALRSSPGGELGRRAASVRADALFAQGAADSSHYAEALAAYRALAADASLAPSARLDVSYRIGRVLERLGKIDEAVDQYYANVLVAYETQADRGVWFDEAARGVFARAAFALADRYEARGADRQAANILRRVVRSGVPASAEARRRLQRLKAKGNVP